MPVQAGISERWHVVCEVFRSQDFAALYSWNKKVSGITMTDENAISVKR